MASRRRSPAAVLLPFVAVLALGAAVKLIPGLLHETTPTSSTPVRRELAGDTLIALAPGRQACLGDVPLNRDGTLAQVYVRSVRAPGADLRVTATAPGYRASGQVHLTPRVDRLYKPEVRVPLAAPPASASGTLCLANRGPGAIELIGSADPRALTRTTATLDGVPQRAAFSLRLLDARRRSLIARAPQLARRAAAFSPFGAWLFWLLVPLVALGVPLLIGGALLAALRAPARDGETG